MPQNIINIRRSYLSEPPGNGILGSRAHLVQLDMRLVCESGFAPVLRGANISYIIPVLLRYFASTYCFYYFFTSFLPLCNATLMLILEIWANI